MTGGECMILVMTTSTPPQAWTVPADLTIDGIIFVGAATGLVSRNPQIVANDVAVGGQRFWYDFIFACRSVTNCFVYTPVGALAKKGEIIYFSVDASSEFYVYYTVSNPVE
jgi:hypothetical protein